MSIRQIATEAGLATTTVWQFLRGSTPHPGTHAKLASWYLRHRTDSAATDPGLAEAAIDLLTRGLQPQAREAFVREFIRAYEASSAGDVPAWLDVLRPPDAERRR